MTRHNMRVRRFSLCTLAVGLCGTVFSGLDSSAQAGSLTLQERQADGFLKNIVAGGGVSANWSPVWRSGTWAFSGLQSPLVIVAPVFAPAAQTDAVTLNFAKVGGGTLTISGGNPISGVI